MHFHGWHLFAEESNPNFIQIICYNKVIQYNNKAADTWAVPPIWLRRTVWTCGVRIVRVEWTECYTILETLTNTSVRSDSTSVSKVISNESWMDTCALSRWSWFFNIFFFGYSKAHCAFDITQWDTLSPNRRASLTFVSKSESFIILLKAAIFKMVLAQCWACWLVGGCNPSIWNRTNDVWNNRLNAMLKAVWTVCFL